MNLFTADIMCISDLIQPQCSKPFFSLFTSLVTYLFCSAPEEELQCTKGQAGKTQVLWKCCWVGRHIPRYTSQSHWFPEIFWYISYINHYLCFSYRNIYLNPTASNWFMYLRLMQFNQLEFGALNKKQKVKLLSMVIILLFLCVKFIATDAVCQQHSKCCTPPQFKCKVLQL